MRFLTEWTEYENSVYQLTLNVAQDTSVRKTTY